MENKIKIIDEICKRHPSNGVEKGWSHYTGGMMDSGDWHFRKMLDVKESELQDFLNQLIEIENRPKVDQIIRVTEESKIVELPNGGWATQQYIDSSKKNLDELVANMLFGTAPKIDS